MSNKRNHRRGHGRIQGNGPRYENPNPSDGCNSTHVAKGRRDWKRIGNRALRRTGGKSEGGRWGAPLTGPTVDQDWGEE